MINRLLRRIAPAEVAPRRTAVDEVALRTVTPIVQSVQLEGEPALRRWAEHFGELAPGDPIRRGPDDMHRALQTFPAGDRRVLERTADRVRSFAEAQRAMHRHITQKIPGGEIGHTIVPIDAAGCYTPGGRHPLPSSVIMTAVTARVAGCRRVTVASPKPTSVTLAAAALSGADEVLAVGGAHAIATLAYGFDGFDPVDLIVGPGNRWVTAAKKLVLGVVGIDMLAGPSELLIMADESADDRLVAADLLAQAEHDVDATVTLVTTAPQLVDDVERELAEQLAELSTRETAREALRRNGVAVVAPSQAVACAVVNRLAPEHLSIHMQDATQVASSVRHAGAIFLGAGSAEVFGDYGAGPNHTLPTGGAARFSAGLSVGHFLRARSWMRLDSPGEFRELSADVARLAELEGLGAHARSARAR